MRDVLGNELRCGNNVIIALKGKEIKIGKILSFTLNNKARVEVGATFFLRTSEQLYYIEKLA